MTTATMTTTVMLGRKVTPLCTWSATVSALITIKYCKQSALSRAQQQ